MNPLKKVSEIDRLKKIARSHYLAHEKACRDVPSAGNNILAVVRPDVFNHARQFNLAMAELKKTDPDYKHHYINEGN